MKRYGQMIKLKRGGIEKYINYHQNPWPGVNEMINECNLTNYSIFIKDNYLFAYFEYVGKDFIEDMQKMAADSITRKWWDTIKPLMEPIETRNHVEFWADMEEIYHLD